MEKKWSIKRYLILWSVGALTLFCVSFYVLPLVFGTTYSAEPKEIIGDVPAVSIDSAPSYIVTHVPTPEPVKGLYMTACVASVPSWREKLKQLIQSTELNSIVIDIKDYTGTVSFEKGANCYVPDMQQFIDELHKANIYVIGRIAVFQDPHYTAAHPELAVKSKSTGGVWKDRKGLSFIDVGAKPFWDYIVGLANKSYDIGFDEINFDYIRYPSDGNLEDMNFTWMNASSTKAQTLESFFSYLHDHLAGKGKVSADIFGMTTVAKDDMGIGQVLENTLPFFDYVSPMVYPSHFADGTQGYSNPAEHPYEVVHYSMSEARQRELALDVASGIATTTPSKLRPWLQDFDYRATYDVPQVQAQIKATYDSGLTSWLVWDAANKYTPAAYLPDLTQQ